MGEYINRDPEQPEKITDKELIEWLSSYKELFPIDVLNRLKREFEDPQDGDEMRKRVLEVYQLSFLPEQQKHPNYIKVILESIKSDLDIL